MNPALWRTTHPPLRKKNHLPHTQRMQVVEEGARSTLYYDSATDALQRRYHDTGAWSEPFAPTYDDKGRARYRGNRPLASACVAERVYAGGARAQTQTPEHTPHHLQTALRALCASRDVDEVARRLGVKVTTAWSYVGEVTARWPAARAPAAALVHPRVLRAVRDCADRTGALRALVHRLDLARDPDLRALPDLYAHVRLARLVLT